MNRRLYAIHRWISAIAFIQLALWTISGSFFVLVPIARVHGEHVEGAHDAVFADNLGVLTPAVALAIAAESGIGSASSLELRPGPAGALYYLVRSSERVVRMDARTGGLAPVTRFEAEATAVRDQPRSPHVLDALLLGNAGTEYRGKPLPVWQVRMADSGGTVVYVDGRTGEVTARRNDVWRIYDFLWSLHIMDYGRREDFNHPLIMVAAAVAFATVASGSVLWAVRIVRRVRKREPGTAKTKAT